MVVDWRGRFNRPDADLAATRGGARLVVATRTLLLMAGGGWFGAALALAAAAAWFRLSGSYDVDEQFAVQLLTVAECAMATAGLVCSLPLLVRTAASRAAARLSLFAVVVPVFFAFALQILALEHESENRAKNRLYLARHAEIVTRYYRAKGRMPESFDRALEWSGERLPWRGDADGHDVRYAKLDRSRFLICSAAPRLHLAIERTRVRVSTWPHGQPDPCRE